MRNGAAVMCPLALGWLCACGVPAEEYDARVKQLREAEDKTAECRTRIDSEAKELAETESNAEQLRQSVRTLEQERLASGLTTDAAKAHYRQLLADEANAQRLAAERAAERASLATNLQEEVTAGVLSVDERGARLRIVIPEEVLFSIGSSSLGPPGKKVLDAVVRELKSRAGRSVLVAAFVDHGPKSKPKEDLTLTLERARRVLDYCVKQGVEPERMAAAGFGSAEPIADNQSDKLRGRNRRLEIELLALPARAMPAVRPPTQGDDPGL